MSNTEKRPLFEGRVVVQPDQGRPYKFDPITTAPITRAEVIAHAVNCVKEDGGDDEMVEIARLQFSTWDGDRPFQATIRTPQAWYLFTWLVHEPVVWPRWVPRFLRAAS